MTACACWPTHLGTGHSSPVGLEAVRYDRHDAKGPVVTDLRTFEELIDPQSPVWADIAECIDQGVNTVLPVSLGDARDQMTKLQMTNWSTPGAMTLNCGGILADYGWIKLLGGGTRDLPSLQDYVQTDIEAVGFGVCAVDVLGGVFAINWGVFDGPAHGLWYWAPDSLGWEPCGEWKHWDLLYFALTGQMDQFYSDWRWPGWEGDCAVLAADEGIMLTPEPFTTQDRAKTQISARAVPMAEICRTYQNYTHPDGLFHDRSKANRYPIYWVRGQHHRPDIDFFPTEKTLTDVAHPLWPQLHELIASGPHQVLPPDPDVARLRLVHLEHSVGTGIGAMVYNCAMTLADHGWLRLLGCGTDHPDSVDLVSGLGRRILWLVAYDVLGGIFVMNLGYFTASSSDLGLMWHWSSATGRWHAMGISYEEFLTWSLSDGLAGYYGQLRWPGWEKITQALSPQDGLIDRRPAPMTDVIARHAALDTHDPYPIEPVDWPQRSGDTHDGA